MIASFAAHLGFTHLVPTPLAVVCLTFMAFMVLTSLRAIPAMSLLAGLAPPALRGRYMAINMAVSDSASGLGAWVGGLVVSAPAGAALLNVERLGWLAAAITVLSLGTPAVLVKRPARQAITSPL